jgi:uncharacterized protein (TIGR02246 family)
MERSDVHAWVDRYVRAWKTNDPEDVRSLFTEDGRYATAPYRDPWSGHQGIVEGWLERKDQEGTWDFTYDVQGIDREAGLAFVRGRTVYHDEGIAYANLWVIRMHGDGRCLEFVEWWMQEQ